MKTLDCIRALYEAKNTGSERTWDEEFVKEVLQSPPIIMDVDWATSKNVFAKVGLPQLTAINFSYYYCKGPNFNEGTKTLHTLLQGLLIPPRPLEDFL